MKVKSLVKGGRLRDEARRMIIQEMKEREGEIVEVEISGDEEKRSLSQNKYFHACLKQLKDEVKQWNTINEVKHYLKIKLNLFDVGEIKLEDGTMAHYPMYYETSKMNKKQFKALIDDMEEFFLDKHSIIMIRPEDLRYSPNYFA